MVCARFFLTGSGKPKTVKKETANNIKVNITNNGTTNLNVSAPVGVSGGSVEEVSGLDQLAYAVAVAETSNCTKGYGVTHKNCHGIKKGNTYPCPTKKGSRMCNFASTDESFKAFKIIWKKWYKNTVPTMANANTWTGRDRASTWLQHVKSNL